MTKEEALTLLNKGVKIAHIHFTDQEWIKKHPKSTKHYLDEAGNVIGANDFWRWRTAPRWQENWKVYGKQ